MRARGYGGVSLLLLLSITAVISVAQPVSGQPFVYVANLGSDTVTVINVAAQRALATIPVGSEPNGVAVSLDGRQVFVTNFASDDVSIIDAATHSVRSTVPVGAEPVGIAVTPDGTRAYVANRGADSVSVIDLTTESVVTTIPVWRGPNAVAVSPDGESVYVTNSFSKDPGILSVLSTAFDQMSGFVVVQRRPNRVAVAPDGFVYVTNFRSWNVSVIDPASRQVVTTVRVSGRPSGITANPNGATVYVSTLDDGVSIIETATNHVTRKLAIEGEPWGIGVTRNGGLGYVASFDTRTVSVLDLGVEETIGTIRVGERPFAVAVGCSGSTCNEAPYTPRHTRTATPVRTPVPTRIPTSTPSRTLRPQPTSSLPPASAAIEPLSGHPGESLQLQVSFTASDTPVAGVQMDLPMEHVVVRPRATGRPDCIVNPSINKNGTSSSYQPAGCQPAEDCTAVRVFVLALDNTDPIPNGAVLFTCQVEVKPEAQPGSHRIGVTNAGASDPIGGAVPLIVTGGIQVLGNAALSYGALVGEASASGICASGPRAGEACARDDDCLAGACIRAQGVCDGGADEGLLCDCAGGACSAELCGVDERFGTCRGGAFDGQCCRRSMACAGGNPCVSTIRVCDSGLGKGLACLRDDHCSGARCITTSRRCVGGDFDGFACRDDSDCPLGFCTSQDVLPRKPPTQTGGDLPRATPTPIGNLPPRTPTASSGPPPDSTVAPTVPAAPTATRSSVPDDDDGCSVQSASGMAALWHLLFPAVVLLTARRRAVR